MKKTLYMLMLFCLILLSAAGCADNDARSGNGSSGTPGTTAEVKKVDVDLTVLSSTMVYAEVNNILTNPGKYIGKIIKMSGLYYSSYSDQTDLNYHYVVIEDVTACCAQGLEFIWSGEHKYPADYPDEGANVEVTGVFGSYDELGMTYYFLAVDNITILK